MSGGRACQSARRSKTRVHSGRSGTARGTPLRFGCFFTSVFFTSVAMSSKTAKKRSKVTKSRRAVLFLPDPAGLEGIPMASCAQVATTASWGVPDLTSDGPAQTRCLSTSAVVCIALVLPPPLPSPGATRGQNAAPDGNIRRSWRAAAKRCVGVSWEGWLRAGMQVCRQPRREPRSCRPVSCAGTRHKYYGACRKTSTSLPPQRSTCRLPGRRTYGGDALFSHTQ